MKRIFHMLLSCTILFFMTTTVTMAYTDAELDTVFR